MKETFEEAKRKFLLRRIFNPTGGGPFTLIGSDAKNSSACSYSGRFFLCFNWRIIYRMIVNNLKNYANSSSKKEICCKNVNKLEYLGCRIRLFFLFDRKVVDMKIKRNHVLNLQIRFPIISIIIAHIDPFD